MQHSDLRRFAHLNGHGEAFDRIWVEPKTSADGRWAAWYRAALGHRLEPERVADPGPEPPLPDSPLFWREKYAACAFEVLASYRAQDLRRAHFADIALQNILRDAWGGGHRLECERWLVSPGTTDAATLDGWQAELEHRLAHNGASGGHYPVPRPLPRLFTTVAELEARDAAERSAVVLLAEWQGHAPGAWLQLDAATSWELTERGVASWARNAPIPPDVREPVEAALGDDWPELKFLRRARLTTRHMMSEGDVRRVAPDEARALVEAGVAELYEPPPPSPAPPKPVVTFE